MVNIKVIMVQGKVGLRFVYLGTDENGQYRSFTSTASIKEGHVVSFNGGKLWN